MNASSAFSPADVGSGASGSSGLGAQARGFADDAKQSAETFAEQRKSEGAERLQGMADTAGRVADEVADESPVMADWVRKAAHGLDDVSRNLKDRSVGDLLDMAKSFARREPAAFIAASAVAGFALSRLLKSTSAASGPQTASSGQTPPPPPSTAPAAPTSDDPTSPSHKPVITPVTPVAVSSAPGSAKPHGSAAADDKKPVGVTTAPTADPTSRVGADKPAPVVGGSATTSKPGDGDPST